jgi:hypothetical protein
MTSFSIDLADAVEEVVADYIDGRIAMQRHADPNDPLISSEELLQRLEND